MEADEAEREEAGQFRAALGGRHRRGGERVGATNGTGIEHHGPWVQDNASARDLGTGHPVPGRKG